MDIVINLDKVIGIFSLPADVLAAKAFLYLGWIPIAIFIMWAAFLLWMSYIQDIYGSKREFIYLALDVPVLNEQTPAAVEKMFAHLAGAHSTNNLIETYWEGKGQDSFSFEIVSIEGYTQYVVRTMPKYRELIEAMIYAEYPETEITEVEDYTTDMPDKFPDENYDIWGSEFILVKSSYYPIKTYIEFEHQFSGDFKDPLAGMMELFNGLRKGEQCWYQIILTPVGQEFPAGADDEINKAIGAKLKPGKDIVDKLILDPLLSFLSGIADFIIPSSAEENKQDEERDVNMLNLKPLQKKSMEAIQQKVSKLVFEVKIRFIYIAEKEIINKTRVNSFVGVMKQFGVEDLNAFKPDMNVTATSTAYLWKEQRLNARKTRIIQAYKNRSNWSGRLGYYLNIEELATIWHFPVETAVKAPMLQKVSSRKSEAPSYLPIEGAVTVSTSDIELQKDLSTDKIFDINSLEEDIKNKKVETTVEEDIFSENLSFDKNDTPEQGGPPINLPIG